MEIELAFRMSFSASLCGLQCHPVDLCCDSWTLLDSLANCLLSSVLRALSSCFVIASERALGRHILLSCYAGCYSIKDVLSLEEDKDS